MASSFLQLRGDIFVLLPECLARLCSRGERYGTWSPPKPESMSLEEHLSLYGVEGTYDSTGSFTLDREKALSKLAAFSLEHWMEILFLLAAWLDCDHHGPVEFLFRSKRLTVRRESSSLRAEHLEHLEDYALVDGEYRGPSLLALVQHLWCSHGDLVIEAQGVRRLWQRGKTVTETGGIESGLQLELIHPKIKADSRNTTDFFSKHLRWTSFDWTLNGLHLDRMSSTPRTLMMLNTAPVNLVVVPGVVASRPDWDFQMLARWEPASSATVVVEGIAYPLCEPLFEGFQCVVFCRQVQRNLTRTEAVVSQAQRDQWTEALNLLIEGFMGKAHFWKNEHFLTEHSAAFCRVLWPSLEKRSCLAAAQRLVSSVPYETNSRLLQARLLMREKKFGSAIKVILPLSKEHLTAEELDYASLVEEEFVNFSPELLSDKEELEELVSDFGENLGQLSNFPRVLQTYFLALARMSEEKGDFLQAERYYLDSYFWPRRKSTEWAIFLQRGSLMDKTNSGMPLWMDKTDSGGEYLEGLLSVFALAQARQSSQQKALELLNSQLAGYMPPEFVARWNILRLEAWRLERRHSQREWYKWLLVGFRKAWKPTFAPLSHDESYQLPKLLSGNSPEVRLAELRSRTAYLEYANLAHRLAKQTGQMGQMARFESILKEHAELFAAYQAPEEKEHLWELGRIALELGERDKASDYLQRAICRVPARDFLRLPLLVDLAILEPHRAVSVVNGLVRVLHIQEQAVGTTFERRVDQCLWPFPYELPSRLRRLAWELEPAEELRVYRIAQLLFGRLLGSKWNDASEMDWVNDAIGVLS